MSARCRSCGAAIVWVVTENGRRMPLDAEPVVQTPHGLFTVEDPVDGPLASSVNGNLYRSHFATCKDSDEWRKT